MFCSKLCVGFLFIRRNNSSGRIYDSSQSVFIKEMHQILAFSSLGAVTGHQNIGLGHYLS